MIEAHALHPVPAPLTPHPSPAGWSLPARTLPIPAAASEVLRRDLALSPAPDLEATRRERPASLEEWREVIASRDLEETLRAEALAERFGMAIASEVIGGVTVRRVMPKRVHPGHRDHLFVHLHGGGYALSSGMAGTSEATLIAHHGGIPVVSIDYRCPPEHPFPAALDDVTATWRGLLAQHPPRAMALGGTSAGGGLAVAALHRFLAQGLDCPGALWAGTPWVDLGRSSDSLHSLEGVDRCLISADGLLGGLAELYTRGHDITDPLVSPIHGRFEGFPPTSLVTGPRDLFLSDTARLHRRLREAGSIADLNVYEGMAHADYIQLPDSPESVQVFTELGAFLRTYLA